MGFDWVWFLGVWQTGDRPGGASRARNPEWRRECRQTLPDLRERGHRRLAVRDPGLHACTGDFGGDAALARLRERLRARGLQLLLDFVPNHTAPDHPWVERAPRVLRPGQRGRTWRASRRTTRACDGRAGDLRCSPTAAIRTSTAGPTRSSSTTATRRLPEAMIGELARIATLRRRALRHGDAAAAGDHPADLGRRAGRDGSGRGVDPRRVSQARHPTSCFIAEVYWDLEWALQQAGFDYTYDKRLYDRLRAGRARRCASTSRAALDFQDQLAALPREPRRAARRRDVPAAACTRPPRSSRTDAGAALLPRGPARGPAQAHLDAPGRARPWSPSTRSCAGSTTVCSAVLRRAELRDGEWRLLECAPAWDGNRTSDCFIAWSWRGSDGERARDRGQLRRQCEPVLPATRHLPSSPARAVRLEDLLSDASYDRDGDD